MWLARFHSMARCPCQVLPSLTIQGNHAVLSQVDALRLVICASQANDISAHGVMLVSLSCGMYCINIPSNGIGTNSIHEHVRTEA